MSMNRMQDAAEQAAKQEKTTIEVDPSELKTPEEASKDETKTVSPAPQKEEVDDRTWYQIRADKAAAKAKAKKAKKEKEGKKPMSNKVKAGLVALGAGAVVLGGVIVKSLLDRDVEPDEDGCVADVTATVEDMTEAAE